jgi:hypothetical protein
VTRQPKGREFRERALLVQLRQFRAVIEKYMTAGDADRVRESYDLMLAELCDLFEERRLGTASQLERLRRREGEDRPAHRPFRGLLGVHSRYGLHTRRVTVFRDALVTRGFNCFVTSTVAPVASGWSISPGGTLTHWKAPPLHGAPA